MKLPKRVNYPLFLKEHYYHKWYIDIGRQIHFKLADTTKKIIFIVKISTQRKISTKRMPCDNDPKYNFFKCAEDYYSRKRGCQYPWNFNKNSNITICKKYSDFSPLFWHFNQNVDTGAGRENFKLSEILLEKGMHCPPPCFLKEYLIEFFLPLSRL